MKTLYKKTQGYCKFNIPSSFFCLFVLIVASSIYTPAFATNNYCRPLSASSQNKLTKKFQQSPFEIPQTVLQLPHKKEYLDNAHQNILITSSFDTDYIRNSILKLFKSKSLSKVFFDWIRTQYFSSVQKNIHNQSDFLFKLKSDLLTKSEQSRVLLHKNIITKINQHSCTPSEKNILNCNFLYAVTVQNTPELSCKNKQHFLAFESKVYMTFSKKYGFKVVDISIAGKRIVLDSLKHLIDLKKKGYNNNALVKHVSSLSKDPGLFNFPKSKISTKKFLARLKSQSLERLPASL